MSGETLERLIQATSDVDGRVQELGFLFVSHLNSEGPPGRLAIYSCGVCGEPGHGAGSHQQVSDEIDALTDRIGELESELEAAREELEVERSFSRVLADEFSKANAELHRLQHQINGVAVHANPTRP
jgi:hypothetical protein